MSDDDEFNADNFSSSTSKVDEATSSSNSDDTNNITITDDNASIVVGRWTMINCEVNYSKL